MCLLVFGFAPAARAQTNTALVRILHAAQDVPPVDVYVNGNVVLTDVRYLQVSGYLEVPVGSQNVALAPAGTSAAEAVFSTALDIAADKTYSVVAVNDNGVKAQVVNDDLAALPAGKARLRFIHGSPDAPGVNVALGDSAPLFNNVAYGDASDYTLVDAGIYALKLTAADSDAAVLALPNTELKAGVVYDVVAAGNLAQLRAQILTARPAAEGDIVPDPNAAAPAPNAATPPQRMPVTGASDSLNWLLALLASMLIGGGVLLRVSNARLLERDDVVVKEIALRVRASIRDIVR